MGEITGKIRLKDTMYVYRAKDNMYIDNAHVIRTLKQLVYKMEQTKNILNPSRIGKGDDLDF